MKDLRHGYEEELKYQFKKHIYYGLGEQKIQDILKKNLLNTTLTVGDLKIPRSVKIFVENGDLQPIQSIKQLK